MSQTTNHKSDLLGHSVQLNWSDQFPVLGVPVLFKTNSTTVMAVVERTFSIWRSLSSELIEDISPLIIDLVVHESTPDGTQSDTGDVFVHRYHGDTYLAGCGANLLTARRSEGRALAFVTPELVADTLRFEREVLECLALLLTIWKRRTPLHAAVVVKNNRAIMLLGMSGVGKSTLSYVCVRAGFQLLSEDTVYLSVMPSFRLWGNPRRIHLHPDAVCHFPELDGIKSAIGTNPVKIALGSEHLGLDYGCLHSESVSVCLLTPQHQESESRLEAIPQQVAETFLLNQQEPGFDVSTHERAAAVAALLHAPTYRLSVGNDLNAAVEILDRLVSQ